MSNLFLKVLNMSITASYVILFVILIRLLLKKAPKVISYALWGVVAFRLIVPFSVESIFSLMPRNTIMVPSSSQQIQQGNNELEVIDFGGDALSTRILGRNEDNSFPTPVFGTNENNSLPTTVNTASVNSMLNHIEIWAFSWFSGIIALLVYSFASILLLKKKLRRGQLVETNIYEVKNLKTPFVLGVIKPKIYLPVKLKDEERRYILLHEKTHIQRKDHIIKVFAFLTLSVHWFNPLVWIAFVLMSTDMEMSCDEKVLKDKNYDIKKSYANSLLSVAVGGHIISGSPLAFGEGNVKGRIKNVLNYKKPPFWILIITFAIVTVVSAGLLSNPKTSKSNEESAVSYEKVVNLLNPSITKDNDSETTKLELISQMDINWDNQEESIYLDKSEIKDRVVTIRIMDASGNELWSEQLSTSHAGWDQLFLFELDEKQYLLRYNPAMFQGYSSYIYTLFTLENGKEKVIRTDTLEFDVNGTKELDASKMLAFADEVNKLLAKSTLLISSNGGVFSFGPDSTQSFYERFSWLDEYEMFFVDGDSLESKINKFSEYTVAQRKYMDQVYGSDTSDAEGIVYDTDYTRVRIARISDEQDLESGREYVFDIKVVSYIDLMIKSSLTPTKETNLNNSNIIQYSIEFFNNIGGYGCSLYYDIQDNKAYIVRDGGSYEVEAELGNYVYSLMN